jgi:hypothetical protein
MTDKHLEEFKKRWAKKAEEIKKNAFSKEWAYWLKTDFIKELLFVMHGENWQFELTKLSHDVDLALYIAISNYEKERLKHRRFWEFSTPWASFKLPEAPIK